VSKLLSAKIRYKSSSGVSTFDPPRDALARFRCGHAGWATCACCYQDLRWQDHLAARTHQTMLRLPNVRF